MFTATGGKLHLTGSILYIGQEPAWQDWLYGLGFRLHCQPEDRLSPGTKVDLTIWNLQESDLSLLAAWTSQAPLLVIGETTNRRGAIAAARAMACDYLLRPFAPRELLRAIHQGLQNSEKLERVNGDLGILAEHLCSTSSVPNPIPRVSQARAMAMRSFFLLLRAQVMPRLVAWNLWRRLLLLEKIYLHGLYHPVSDDPAPYLLLNLDLLAAPLSPWRKLDRGASADCPEAEAYRRFHDRVEQREIEESVFLLAAPLWLCRASPPTEFRDRFELCWS